MRVRCLIFTRSDDCWFLNCNSRVSSLSRNHCIIKQHAQEYVLARKPADFFVASRRNIRILRFFFILLFFISTFAIDLSRTVPTTSLYTLNFSSSRVHGRPQKSRWLFPDYFVCDRPLGPVLKRSAIDRNVIVVYRADNPVRKYQEVRWSPDVLKES